MESIWDLFTGPAWDVLLIGVNALAISAVIMSAYFIQRWMERRADRYNTASVMFNEVERILGIASRSASPDIQHAAYPIGIRPSDRLAKPRKEIYHGLFFSGNMKHLTDNMQRSLAELYDGFEHNLLSPDIPLCTKVRSDLKKVMEQNRRWHPVFKL